MAQRKTNTQFIQDVMNYSRNGPMMQVFVIECLRIYSEQIKTADLSSMENGFISPDAWRACANEILEKLEAKNSHD